MTAVTYHYNGILTQQVTDWVHGMLQDYPFVLEVIHMAPVVDFDALFADRSWESAGEDCMGQRTTMHRTGVPFGYVRKYDYHNDDLTGFLFLKDSDSYRRFIERFPELIVNPTPFRTEFA